MLRVLSVLGGVAMAAGTIGYMCDTTSDCGSANEQCLTSKKRDDYGGQRCHGVPLAAAGAACANPGTSPSGGNDYKCSGSMSCFGDKSSNYVCRAQSSTGPCNKMSDCTEASYCNTGTYDILKETTPGTCTVKKVDGTVCELSVECQSGDCYVKDGDADMKCNPNRFAQALEAAAAGFSALIIICIIIPILLGIVIIVLIWYCCCRKKSQVVVVQQQPVAAQPVMMQPGQQPMMMQPGQQPMMAQPGQQPMMAQPVQQ